MEEMKKAEEKEKEELKKYQES